MDYETLKLAYTHDAAFAIAATLGFDSFMPIGDNRVRFFCSKMPTVKRTQTSVEIVEQAPIYQTNITRSRASRLLPPARNPRSRTEELFDELGSMPSLFDRQPSEQRRTVNTTTTEVSLTPDPLVPIDLVLPADFRYTTTKEIYECLKTFFKNLLNKIESLDPLKANTMNIERLRDAAICFLKTNKNVEGDSGLAMPLQISLDGIYRGLDETCLGTIRSLQYYNQNPNSPEAQLARFIANNSELMFNSPKFRAIVNDPKFFDWVIGQLSKYVSREDIESMTGNYVVEQDLPLRDKVVDLLNGVADMIWPTKKKK